tara:strand:- start:268 stop:1374 length:1107 start_codon:yes stop_codon:yes gene_type:complete
MIKSKLKIKTKNQSYNVIVGNDLIKNLPNILKNNSINFNKCLFVIDSNIPLKFLKKIKFFIKKKNNFQYIFNSSEINKNQKTINKLLNILLKNNFHRNDCLISIGGGIAGDVSSFAASIFKRGIKFINIPTTLLAQVDSSIGGKTGINSEYGKNLIGTFYQPHLVISDTTFLASLPKREIICGYAEILKHSLIKSQKLFNYLNNNAHNILKLKKPFLEKAIFESCLIKKIIVEKDENEKNIRQILNFGHTFAHAFERTNNYSKKLNHGEAVLFGMICASNFAYKKKIINKIDYNKILNHYKKFKLPMNIKNLFSKKNIKKILFFMKKDKKNNNNKINLVLLKKIGKVNYNCQFNDSQLYSFFLKELTN